MRLVPGWLVELVADGSLTRLVNSGEQAGLLQAVRVLEEVAGRAGVR